MKRAASAIFSDACSSPSAAMILARRSRSASAWRPMARWICSGRSRSRSSTRRTSTPHSSVWRSSAWRSSASMTSRLDRSSSRSWWPTTERSAVWAISEEAWYQFCTLTTEATGSMTRRKATASSCRVTLSLVITCWGCTGTAISCRLVRTILSMNGTMKKTPGPLAPTQRPSRKMTPRSYSCTTFTEEIRNSRTMTTRAPSTMPTAAMSVSRGRCTGEGSLRPCALPARRTGAAGERGGGVEPPGI